MIEDKINEEKTKQWNESISPRLESLRAWFSSDDWQKGLKVYLGNILQKRREHLEASENSALVDQFIKGQIAAFREFMAIPKFIEQQIEMIEKNKTAGPRGDAGY